ncbi:hypothetical protein CEK29_22280 [Bordetella genomosp. 5]|nr:hypothetical protein CEK29_22280 [Bordetella genomosp. 5]
MKLYLVSLGAGVLVGVIYALLQVRSPAPPVVALLGLLGMLIGEQVVPPVKRWLAGEPVTISWFHSECVPKITGMPGPAAGTPAAGGPVAGTPAAGAPVAGGPVAGAAVAGAPVAVATAPVTPTATTPPENKSS